jgi:hypothetical protein
MWLDLTVQRLNEELLSPFALLAQQECLAFCEMIQRRLPRELRDMIFRFTLPPYTVPVEKKFPILGSTTTRSIAWLRTVLPSNCQHLCDPS